jgi:hypothetical protein
LKRKYFFAVPGKKDWSGKPGFRRFWKKRRKCARNKENYMPVLAGQGLSASSKGVRKFGQKKPSGRVFREKNRDKPVKAPRAAETRSAALGRIVRNRKYTEQDIPFSI